MLLTRLAQFAAAHPEQIPPLFHIETGVRWLIDLDAMGRPATGDPIAELIAIRDPADPNGRRGLPMVVPSVGRTSAVVPLLACDKIEYALGWADPKDAQDERKRARAQRYHQAFTDQVSEWALCHPDDSIAQALRIFLTSGAVALIQPPEHYSSSDVVMFRVEGHPAHASTSASAYWGSVASQRKSSGAQDRCLACNTVRPVIKRAIRPVRPGLIPTVGHDPFSKTDRKLGNGPSLVSVNQPAQGFNFEIGLSHTPLCEVCVEGYTGALEHLLKHSDHRRTIGDTAIIWWVTPTDGTQNAATVQSKAPIKLLFKPDPVKIALMLDAPRKGARVIAGTTRTEMFCAATLSNNSARIMVRDWIDIPLPQAEDRIASWFADMEITNPWTDQRHSPSLHRLALALGRWYPGKNGNHGSYAKFGAKGAQRPVWIQRGLLHSALNGTPLSSAMLAHLLLRIRTDGGFDLTRQALLRLCLTRSHPNHARRLSMALDPADNTPAYLAGRMFAVLESLQYAAARAGGGKINTTVADRYFSRAVTSPASALIPAVRGSRAHLKKLQTHDRQNYSDFFARTLNELIGRLRPFPTSLALYDQGQFLNGYADQRNHDITRARARRLAADDLIPDSTTDDDAETDITEHAPQEN
ncbi:type I-C CRISPR-associated protein Cas8c/Csd1 [Streptosporangium sp. NPDC001681]|uniref:type I-C CRISPR-associated protein Cas8c/Csd1 n=1 Tax=Streptosporangium sp. NPDC001681 TaxID=3154395 RepID=UPI00331B9A91